MKYLSQDQPEDSHFLVFSSVESFRTTVSLMLTFSSAIAFTAEVAVVKVEISVLASLVRRSGEIPRLAKRRSVSSFTAF
jgi:hypothetical protein